MTLSDCPRSDRQPSSMDFGTFYGFIITSVWDVWRKGNLFTITPSTALHLVFKLEIATSDGTYTIFQWSSYHLPMVFIPSPVSLHSIFRWSLYHLPLVFIPSSDGMKGMKGCFVCTKSLDEDQLVAGRKAMRVPHTQNTGVLKRKRPI